MNSENQTPRERGHRLLRRINRWAIAGAVGLAGLFSVVAAETTHGKTTASTTTSLQQPASTPSASSSSSSTSSNSGNSGTSGNSGSSGSTGNTGSSSVVSGGS